MWIIIYDESEQYRFTVAETEYAELDLLEGMAIKCNLRYSISDYNGKKRQD